MKSILDNKKVAWLCAVICTLLWGTAFPVIKFGYEMMDIQGDDIGSKLLFAGLRFLIGGLMVVLIGAFKSRKKIIPEKADIMPILLLGIVQTALQYFCSYIGVGATTAANTSIITACMSFFVVLFAPSFFKNDKLNFQKIFGCVLGFAGVLIINISVVFSGVSFSFFGEGMVLLSTICAAGGNLITKGVMKGRNPIKITGFQLSLGGVVLIVLGAFMGGGINLFSMGNIVVLLYLAMVSAVSFTLWTAILQHQPVSQISIFNLLVPVFGTVWSGILLGENVFVWQNLLALVLISAGIVSVNITKKIKQR